MRGVQRSFLSALSLACATAFAMTPVPASDFLCSANEIVIGTVAHAARLKWDERSEESCGNLKWECAVPNSDCQLRPHTIRLTIKVISVWAKSTYARSGDTQKEGVYPGQNIELITGLWNNGCSSTGYDAQGFLAPERPIAGPTIAESISPAALQQIYVRKSFIFAVDRTTTDEGEAKPPAPYAAYMFRLSDKAWIAQTLRDRKGVGCPKLVKSDKMPR
jgi:hypothetical protein